MLSMVSEKFFICLLNFFIILNSLFSSVKRFFISFSFPYFALVFSFFFQQFIIFSLFTTFLFSFFNPFFDLFLFNFVKIINPDRFLFKNGGVISYCFIIIWIFPKGSFKLFFVLVRFKNDVEIAF